MPSVMCSAFLAIGLLLCGNPTSVADQEPAMTCAEIIARAKAAILSIESVECHWKALTAEGKDRPGAMLERGLAVMYDFEWGWNRKQEEEYWEGGTATIHPDGKQIYYKKEKFAYNGVALRTLQLATYRGLKKPPGNFFTLWRGPLQLVGHYIAYGPHVRNLIELIDKAECSVPAKGSDGYYRLRIVYEEQIGTPYEMIVDVDPAVGFLPRRIQVYQPAPRALIRDFVSSAFVEVEPGVWFPTEGTITFYYIKDMELPPGLTSEELKKMTAAMRVSALARAKCTTAPLGVSPLYYIVDPATLKVNHAIDRGKFTFDFPPGSVYYDEFEDKAVEIPGTPPPPPLAHPARTVRQVVVVVAVNILVALLIANFLIRRHRHLQ